MCGSHAATPSRALSAGLASVGTARRRGYEQTLAWVIDAGGLPVGGAKRHVNLVVLDNHSDLTSSRP